MFDQAKADRICARLEGGDSLRAAAKAEKVAASHVLTWCEQQPAFAERYARARETGYKLLADKIVEVSDDTNIPADQKRIMVDTRKWLLSKVLPKVYGDKLELAGTVNLKRTAGELTDDELAALAQRQHNPPTSGGDPA